MANDPADPDDVVAGLCFFFAGAVAFGVAALSGVDFAVELLDAPLLAGHVRSTISLTLLDPVAPAFGEVSQTVQADSTTIPNAPPPISSVSKPASLSVLLATSKRWPVTSGTGPLAPPQAVAVSATNMSSTMTIPRWCI